MDLGLFEPLAISLGLGLLVGLQREWKESGIAGIRTFTLITLLGTLAMILDGPRPGWLTAAGVLAVTALLVMGNLFKLRRNEIDPGMTTEAAALVMYCVGAALGAGYTAPAIAVAGTVAVLLHWKQQLHGLVRRIGENELRGVMHLVLIALVILPVLPDETFGPYDVLNPFKIWLMVVFIVGISLAAYLVNRLVGDRAGAVVGGVLGGLISSTATTVSYARQAKNDERLIALSALVIVVASTIVNGRVLLEIGVVSPALLQTAAPPLCVLMAAMAGLCLWFYWRLPREARKAPAHENPAQLKAAVVFGGLYAAILFVVAMATDRFGTQALYVVAMISGLTDVDAITLSTAEMVNRDRLPADTAWRVVLVALMSNLTFKAGIVALLGGRRLMKVVALAFGVSFLIGLLLVLFWPNGLS